MTTVQTHYCYNEADNDNASGGAMLSSYFVVRCPSRPAKQLLNKRNGSGS